MKNKILIGLCAIGVALVALGQTVLPTYKSFSVTGTTNAIVVVPQSPTAQVRIISAIESSDLASSTLSLYSGGTSHYVTTGATNTNTIVVLESTNGISTSSLLYIQGSSSNGVFAISAVGSNYVTLSQSWLNGGTTLGFVANSNAEVEVLSAGPVLSVGAANFKSYVSDGLYVGNYGRAAVAVLTGTAAATNNIGVHYDSTTY